MARSSLFITKTIGKEDEKLSKWEIVGKVIKNLEGLVVLFFCLGIIGGIIVFN